MKKGIQLNFQLLADLIMRNAHDSLQYRIQNAISENSKNYGYIPISPSVLQMILKDIHLSIKNIDTKNFMDIGCGNPIIPKAMKILGFKEAKGLEINDLYLSLDKHKGDHLIKGDLLTYNFNDWDVLYAYNPIKDEKLMNEGLENIFKTMKPGATLYYVTASTVYPKNLSFFNKTQSQGNSFHKYIKPRK